MAVTKQAYAAIAPWSATDVAGIFQQAFIGAGLMTSWYDSFTATREHRVLEVVYDGAKTYGKTYYWFTFDGVGVWVRTSTGWNTTTHVPTGTQYVDYFDTLTSSNNAAYPMLTVSNSISVSLTRYTSGTRSFFVLRSGTTYFTFTIDPPDTTFRTFYDFSKGYHSGIWRASATQQQVRFSSLTRNRRELFLGSTLNQYQAEGAHRTEMVFNILSLPRNNGSWSVWDGQPNEGFILPGWTTGSNPSAGSNFNPVFTNIRPNSVQTGDLPADFGVSCIKNSNILAIQDNATVTAGVEEYEILAFANSGTSNGITNNPVFLARII